MIPQPVKRCLALWAAVATVGEVPDHLHPRQLRVIPPARPRSRPPPGALPAASRPGLIPATVTAGRPGPGPFRGPAEQHPLQHRQLGVHPLQLAVPDRQLLTQPRDLLPLPLHQPNEPLIRLQRLRQRRLQARDRIRFHEHSASHEPTADTRTNRKSRTAPGVSHPGQRTQNRKPATRLPTTYHEIAIARALDWRGNEFPPRTAKHWWLTLVDPTGRKAGNRVSADPMNF